MALKITKPQIIIGLILALFTAIGCFNLLLQNTVGMENTNLSDFVPWGLYIVNFTIFLGGGAAVLIYMLLFWKNISKSATAIIGHSLLAFMILSLSGVFILADLGRIDRFFYLIIYGQPSSPLFIDFLFMNGAIGIASIYLLAGLRRLLIERNNKSIWSGILMTDKKINIPTGIQAVIRYGSLLFLIGGYIVTTELFAGMKSHSLWHTPVTIVNFLVDTLLSGIALILLFVGGKSIPAIFKKSGLSVLILINLALLTLVHLSGELFSAKGVVSIIGVNIIALLILFKGSNNDSSIIKFGSFVLLIGIILERAQFINTGFLEKWVPYPDNISYIPSMAELSVSVGFYCGLVLFWGLFSIMLNSSKSNN